jgi:hypothetical protein
VSETPLECEAAASCAGMTDEDFSGPQACPHCLQALADRTRAERERDAARAQLAASEAWADRQRQYELAMGFVKSHWEQFVGWSAELAGTPCDLPNGDLTPETLMQYATVTGNPWLLECATAWDNELRERDAALVQLAAAEARAEQANAESVGRLFTADGAEKWRDRTLAAEARAADLRAALEWLHWQGVRISSVPAVGPPENPRFAPVIGDPLDAGDLVEQLSAACERPGLAGLEEAPSRLRPLPSSEIAKLPGEQAARERVAEALEHPPNETIRGGH